MIAVTDNILPATQPLAMPGTRLMLAWTCVRRVRDVAGMPVLERESLKVIVEPIDRQHAMIEAFIGVDGSHARTLLHRTARPCEMTAATEMIHLDITGADGLRLLALTMTQHTGALVYAQTSLLADAGVARGACDRPSLQRVGEQRLAATA